MERMIIHTPESLLNIHLIYIHLNACWDRVTVRVGKNKNSTVGNQTSYLEKLESGEEKEQKTTARILTYTQPDILLDIRIVCVCVCTRLYSVDFRYRTWTNKQDCLWPEMLLHTSYKKCAGVLIVTKFVSNMYVGLIGEQKDYRRKSSASQLHS